MATGRTAAALVVLVLLLASCSVDTELGVGADVRSAQVTITGSGDATVVAVDMMIELHVGEHAMGERMFRVQTVDVFYEGMAIAAPINLDRPAGFDGVLAPGETVTVMFHGQSIAGAFPAAASTLCPSMPPVQLLVRWEDLTAMEISMANTTTTHVVCQ